MLKIVCVQADNYLGRGKEYIQILADMVSRNMPVGTEYEFICFTNDPEPIDGITIRLLPGNLKGWWNKLYLFKHGLFSHHDRIVYFDLDTVITGDLTDIVNYSGPFAILRDFYRPNGLGSGMMAWQGGVNSYIWFNFEKSGYPDIPGGDQAWIERMRPKCNLWQDILPGQIRSYKVHAEPAIPNGTKVVCFHGQPRPHDCGGWVEQFWKIGGANTLDEVVGNTEEDQLIENIDYSTSLKRDWVDHLPEHSKHAVIVGGGPSLRNLIEVIRCRKALGHHIFALNNSWQYLKEHGIECDFHVMLDARPENAKFIPPDMVKFYASQCDKTVWDKATDAILWNHLNAQKIVENDPRANVYIAGGSTVGLNAMALTCVLGYRNIHLYGFDSSYDDDRHHAYNQDLNDKDRTIVVTAAGKDFLTAPWMAQQVNEFCQLVPQMLDLGCEISVHGTGLLPHVAQHMNDAPSEEIIKIDGLWWPEHDYERDMIIAQSAMANEIMEYVSDRSVCIQAGGNVGVWPKVFSRHFTKVHTFEPDPLNFKCLVLNCKEENIISYECALGSEEGIIGLKRVNGNCGAGYISHGTEIEMITIDSLELSDCGLIQLDIEGYELNALKGAENTIKKHSPVIVVEDNGLSEKYGSKSGAITEYLEEFGYSIAKILNKDIIYTREVQ